MTRDKDTAISIQSKHLESERVRHGFFTRRGGVSGGIYASLNCGPGSEDDRTHVAENRCRVAQALGQDSASLLTLYQVHSHHAVTVTAPFEDGARPHADALVTNRPGLVIGVLTADCAPVLFADAEAGVIAAAHAGWKGALTGIIGSTVAEMEKLGARPANIRAAIGPAIAQASYEVSDDFRGHFLDHDPAFGQFFVEGIRAGHWQFDLQGFVTNRLEDAGVGLIDPLGLDTYVNDGDFFSYRRTTHRREPDYGRQVSAITLTE
jgi:YfiH family protein